MFTALKKLVGSEAVQLRDRNIPAGLQSMNQSLQRRFAKGVQYNSKSFTFNLILLEQSFLKIIAAKTIFFVTHIVKDSVNDFCLACSYCIRILNGICNTLLS